MSERVSGVLTPGHLRRIAAGMKERGTVLRVAMLSLGRLGIFVTWERSRRDSDPPDASPAPRPRSALSRQP